MGKSEVCTGYGVGPSCVACCISENIYGNYLLEVSFDINFKGQRVFESNGRSYLQNKETFYRMLRETTKRFRNDERNGRMGEIGGCFRNVDRLRISRKEMPEPSNSVFETIKGYMQNTGFLGVLGDGSAGCLLYNLADSDGKSFKHKECSDYLCRMARIAEANPYVHTVMREFIIENASLLDSFNYSRMLHVLSHHTSAHRNLGIDPAIFAGKLKQSIKGQLELTLELVTKTEQDGNDSIEEAIRKTKTARYIKAMKMYYLNLGTDRAISLDFSARAFGLSQLMSWKLMLNKNKTKKS